MTDSLASARNRPGLDRLLRIHHFLADKSYPNCSTLSRALESSTKTIQRDLDFMRNRYKLPIDYDSSRKGFYYTEEVHSFPTVTITEGELVTLLIAQKALEQYRGTPLERTLRGAFGKITSQLKDEITFDANDVFTGVSFRSAGTAIVSITIFDQLAHALRLRKEVAISYQKLGEKKPTERCVHPYHLACIQSCWYLIAFDRSRDEIRKFALTRIKSVTPRDATFVRPKDFSAERYFGDSFGVFTGDKPVDVKIEFDAFAAGLVQERDWHKSQKFAAKRGGKLLMSMKVPRLEEVKNWILSWGAHAKVVAPAALAEEVRSEARAVIVLYR